MSQQSSKLSPSVGSAPAWFAMIEPWAEKLMMGAGVVGLIVVFLPALSFELLGVSDTVSVVRDWRGKLALLGYVGVAVLAWQLSRCQDLTTQRSKVWACVIAAGVVLLLAVWLPLSLDGVSSTVVQIRYGVYLNILAALVLAAGAAIQGRRAKLY